ncbi:hypothetical protein INR49_014312, partial [Caranx melampygus]
MSTTHYTLQIQKRPGVSSHPRCQSGRIEVMLPPVTLKSVNPVHGKPQCLSVTWERTLSVFPVSDSEIKGGVLNSQIEFTPMGQLDVQVNNMTESNYSSLVCLFRPDMTYAVRLRHRYQGPWSPWSPWSNAVQGQTAEDAPSAAPAFWRRVKQTDKSGQRLISLLWKPLPHSRANGRVFLYNVTCQTDSAEVLSDHGSCRDLHDTNLSCSLLLLAERCSCALTASNAAGTSPEARIWFLGSSETELPAPPQISITPLDDNSLDVSWTAPASPSVSGFVVEWSAVREKRSSVLHWERVNGSCTALIITEGVKPLELYAVSVTALYGGRVAGRDGTLYIYTRQGVPSAGPNVEVLKISSGQVELSWSPVPVEERHGFIRSYTLHYGESVPGHDHRYSLGNLLPGNYHIFMQANTDAGPGVAGSRVNVRIDSDEVSIVLYAVLPFILTLLALVLMFGLAQSKMVKQKLCQFVPDPSSSSLAHWTPVTTLEVSPLPHSGCQTPVNCPAFNTDLRPPSPSIYSNVVFSQTLNNPPSPVLVPTYRQFNDWQHGTVSYIRLQPGGDSETPECRMTVAPQEGSSSTGLNSPLPQTDELSTYSLSLKQHQSPFSLSDFSSIFPSSANANSPKQLFQSNLNSVLPLTPDLFTQS